MLPRLTSVFQLDSTRSSRNRMLDGHVCARCGSAGEARLKTAKAQDNRKAARSSGLSELEEQQSIPQTQAFSGFLNPDATSTRQAPVKQSTAASPQTSAALTTNSDAAAPGSGFIGSRLSGDETTIPAARGPSSDVSENTSARGIAPSTDVSNSLKTSDAAAGELDSSFIGNSGTVPTAPSELKKLRILAAAESSNAEAADQSQLEDMLISAEWDSTGFDSSEQNTSTSTHLHQPPFRGRIFTSDNSLQAEGHSERSLSMFLDNYSPGAESADVDREFGPAVSLRAWQEPAVDSAGFQSADRHALQATGFIQSPTGFSFSTSGETSLLPLSQQVATGIYLYAQQESSRRDSSLTLRLDPPDLGELVIRMTRSEDGLVIRVTALETITMDMLLARGDEIQDRLRGQDVHLSELEFLKADADGGGFSSSHHDRRSLLDHRSQQIRSARSRSAAGASAATASGVSGNSASGSTNADRPAAFGFRA